MIQVVVEEHNILVPWCSQVPWTVCLNVSICKCSPSKFSSHFFLHKQSPCNLILIHMENGLNKPNGLNSFAETLNKDLFIGGRVCIYFAISDRSKKRWSSWLSHFIPRILTESSNGVVDVLYSAWCIWSCRVLQLVVHFLRVNPPDLIICHPRSHPHNLKYACGNYAPNFYHYST